MLTSRRTHVPDAMIVAGSDELMIRETSPLDES